MNQMLNTIPTLKPHSRRTPSVTPLATPSLPTFWKTRQNDVVAIIPAYNEDLVIASVVLRVKMYLDNVIVVDDGSHDMTAQLARAAGADVITLPKNMGKAYALMKGFEHARVRNFSAFVTIDGDGQHNAADIIPVATPVLQGLADLVIGSRYLGSDSVTPPYRRLGQKTLDFFTNLGSSYKTTDSQSGFRALSRKAVDNLDFPTEGYSIESDMLAHFAAKNLNIREVPISVRYEVPHKHKKNPVFHGISVLSDIFGQIGCKRPLWFFCLPGLVLAAAGVFTGCLIIADYQATMELSYPVLIASLLAGLFGLLLITSGLIVNSLTRFMNAHK